MITKPIISWFTPAKMVAWQLLLQLLLLVTVVSIATTAEITCPAGCQCRERNTIYLCLNSSLTTIPSDLKENTIVLDLDNNFIFSISNHSLEQAKSLEILSLENNRISLIGANAFKLLTKLRVLNLRHNRVGMLPQNIFINNKDLEVLDLSHNFLYYIPHEAIYYLFNLQVLNISYNGIGTSYLGHGFRYTTHLQMLDLTGNQIPSIETDSFQVTEHWDDSSMHFLNLSYCNIRHIHPNVFKGLNHITGLSLQGNGDISLEMLRDSLATIPTPSLTSLDLSNMNIPHIRRFLNNQQFQRLETLNLSRNQITEIETGMLSFQENLIDLDLSNNEITTIQSLNGLHTLETLNLAHNKLSKINLTTFDGLQNLKALYLSFNNLTHLSGEPFQNLWFLESWDMSHNQLIHVDVNMGFEHLKQIDFSHNKLTRTDFVKMLPRVLEINLSYNKIHSLFVDTFSKGQVVRHFNISNNGLARIEPLTFHPSTLQVLDVSWNKLHQIAHFGWSSSLKELHLSYNNITYMADNAFEGLNSLELLKLTNCNLYTLHNGLFNDLYQLQVLDISHNPIGTFLESQNAKLVFQNLESLETLELSGTKLQQVPSDLFTNPITLREINLENNQISSINTESFEGLLNVRKLHLAYNWLTTFDSSAFTKLTSLQSLDISHNPFKCTCDLKDTCDWLTTTYVNIVQTSTTCFNKEVELDDSSVENVPLYQYCLNMSQTCDTGPKTVFWAVIAGILIFILFIMALVLYKLCTRDRRKHSQKTLAKMEKELEIEKEKMIFQSTKYQYSIQDTKEAKL